MTVNTQNEAREAIYGRFISAWGTETPYVFGNEQYTPPAPAGGAASSWVRLLVRETKSEQYTLGAVGQRKFRRQGQIILMIYALANAGEKRSDVLAQKFRDIFEGADIDDVRCFDAHVIEQGNEGAWYRVNAFCRFDFYEIK